MGIEDGAWSTCGIFILLGQGVPYEPSIYRSRFSFKYVVLESVEGVSLRRREKT
jgi:hypothetical protein